MRCLDFGSLNCGEIIDLEAKELTDIQIPPDLKRSQVNSHDLLKE